MSKTAIFAGDVSEGWPEPQDIARYFLTPSGQRSFLETGDDSGLFTVDGIEGTDHLEDTSCGRKEVNLWLTAHPAFGVMLQWSKWDGKQHQDYHSSGDLTRLREAIPSSHGSKCPLGLFVPLEDAWKAIKDFLENEGGRSNKIAWIESKDLPPDIFLWPKMARR